MKMDEYLKVKDMTYLEYCDYLHAKYGIGLDDYCTPGWSKKKKVTRTKEGLIAHHKMEDHMIMLSTMSIAKECPYEWQMKENIVYCDYLEHLLLHVLICKYPANDLAAGMKVGLGGVLAFLVPELNDLYSGWRPKKAWKKTCLDKVVDDEDVYLAILKQLIEIERDKDDGFDRVFDLHTSYNERYGGWSSRLNEELFDKIDML